MAVEIPVHRRLYMKDRDLARRSAVHTVYSGSGAVQPGTAQQPLKTLHFVFGVARGIPIQDAQPFIDLGHATTERPRLPEEDED